MENNVDWSGYASPISSKKHTPQPPAANEETWKPGRRVGKLSSNTSSTSILGGPVPEKDPSVVGSSHWQTEAQAMHERTKTSREQLTESGRSMFVRGKVGTVPAYEVARPFEESVGARLREENPYALNDKCCDDVGDKENIEEKVHPNTMTLVGYRSGVGARSFLEGLGTEVAASVMPSSDDE